MDAEARYQYISFIDSLHSVGREIPIVISHAAVSGKDFQTIKYLGLCPWYDNYKEFWEGRNRQRGLNCFSQTGLEHVDSFMAKAGWFHPMSNNLFDEEIQAVYRTIGIIGISFEERTLFIGFYLIT